MIVRLAHFSQQSFIPGKSNRILGDENCYSRTQVLRQTVDGRAASFRDFLRFVAMNGTEIGLINGHVARQHVAGEDGCIDRIVKLEWLCRGDSPD